MAKYAYRKIGTGPLIDACELALNQKGKYYCTTPGCTASMHTRSLEKESACFVSDNINEHINPRICQVKDSFNFYKYDESKFNLFDCFNYILSTPQQPQNQERVPRRQIDENETEKLPIRTLKTLYEMCIQYRAKGYYNNYKIDDILVDDYNFNQYKDNICGERIVCCTFYQYDKTNSTISMNYLSDYQNKNFENAKHIKLIVKNNMFEKCLNKLFDLTHENIVVVAGNWNSSNEEDILAECEIYSVGKQICNA